MDKMDIPLVRLLRKRHIDSNPNPNKAHKTLTKTSQSITLNPKSTVSHTTSQQMAPPH